MFSAVLSGLAYAAIVAAALALLAWVARGGPFRGRKVGSAAHDAAIATLQSLQSDDHKNAIEEIVFVQESWSEADREGDDGDRTAVGTDDERITGPR